MSDLLKRLGWTTSLALCAALIGAGCDNRDDATVIDTVEPSPPGIPSTGPGEMTAPADEFGAPDTQPMPADEFGTPEATPPLENDAAAGTGDDLSTGGFETSAPEPADDPAIQPEIQDEPAEPGIDEEPQGDDPN